MESPAGNVTLLRDAKEAHAVHQALQKWQKAIFSQNHTLELHRAEEITVAVIDISRR